MSQTTLRKFLQENISTVDQVNLLCYKELAKQFKVSQKTIKNEIRLIEDAEIARCRQMFKTEFYLYKCIRFANAKPNSGAGKRSTLLQ